MRIVVLFLCGLTATHANAADNWTWTGEARTSVSGQEMYIMNVGSKTFISNENKATQTDILNEKVKSFNFWGSETSASISNDDKYRLKMDGSYIVSWTWTTNIQSGSGATVFELVKNANDNSYKFKKTEETKVWNKKKSDTRYFNVDGTSYTAAQSQGEYNDWLLISPAQKEAYTIYRTAYDAANVYASAALPTATKERLNKALAATTSYQADNYESVVKELNEVTTEIQALSFTLSIEDSYATICIPFNATIPAGVTAYRLNSYNTNNATMELKKYGEEGDVLPAGQGFVLYTESANANAIYTFHFTTTTAAELGTNLLEGSLDATTQDETKNYWVISKSSTTGNVGFFILDEAVTIPAYKAFFTIERTNENAARCNMFSLNGNITGISHTTTQHPTSVLAIYNAASKQQSALVKGLNIVKMSDGSVKKIMKQ